MRRASVAVALLLACSCSTRVDRAASEAAVATPTTAPAPAETGASGGDTATTATPGATVPLVGEPLASAGSAASKSATPGPQASGGSGAVRETAGGATTPTSGGARPSPSAPGGRGGAPAPTGTGLTPPTTAAPRPAPNSGSPVLVASVGTYSGPAASTLKPILEGAQLWVRAIADQGGLNGHPVRLVVYDDGGDPSRHRAQVQEAVEQKKVIAFLGNAEALTGQASNDYIKSHRVPVIGVDGGVDFPYENPMYFLQHPTGNSHYLAFALATAQQLVRIKKTKLATLNCQEAQACTEVDRIFRDRAKSMGLDVVYQARASIAQPDFTAECLAARNAGAESFFVLMDGNSVTRVSNACARQGYKPQYALAAQVILNRFKDDPNLEGMVGQSSVLPWFATGTPAGDEFQRALTAYGGSMQPGVGMVTGWTAGKLLERAGRNLPEPPTSEALLKELWTIRDDNLGGLTYPITFLEGQPSVRKTCWFNVAVKDGKWIAPDGYKQFCGQ